MIFVPLFATGFPLRKDRSMIRLMKIRRLAACLAPVLLLSGSPAAAESESADDIIRRMEALPAPDSSAVRLKMTLVTTRGSREFTRDRTVEMFAKRSAEEGLRSVLRFTEPADVRGVSLLVRENPSGPNDQWLYMPALRGEPRRISGGERNQSFLGTDFTFADLEGRDPESWNHRLLEEKTLDGHAVWVLESTPKTEDAGGYTRVIQSVRKDILLPVRVEFHDGQGLLKILTVEELRQIDGFWIATRSRMENVRRKSATILEILEQRNNLEIPDEQFTTRAMQRG